MSKEENGDENQPASTSENKDDPENLTESDIKDKEDQNLVKETPSKEG